MQLTWICYFNCFFYAAYCASVKFRTDVREKSIKSLIVPHKILYVYPRIKVNFSTGLISSIDQCPLFILYDFMLDSATVEHENWNWVAEQQCSPYKFIINCCFRYSQIKVIEFTRKFSLYCWNSGFGCSGATPVIKKKIEIQINV